MFKPFAYAVVNDQGFIVGAWRDLGVAEDVVKRKHGNPAHNEKVVPLHDRSGMEMALREARAEIERVRDNFFHEHGICEADTNATYFGRDEHTAYDDGLGDALAIIDRLLLARADITAALDAAISEEVCRSAQALAIVDEMMSVDHGFNLSTIRVVTPTLERLGKAIKKLPPLESLL